MDPIPHVQTLARYNAWATERLLAATEVGDEASYRRDVGLFFKSIHGTLNRGQITAALRALGHPCHDIVYRLQGEAAHS